MFRKAKETLHLMSLSKHRETYPVNEIFYSLQGEGYWTGTPALFIRFSGCNLRCPFCDTDFKEHTMMTVDAIMEIVTASPAPIVVLTGGEPSLQPLEPLLLELGKSGKRIHIETNGTNPLPENIDWVTLSPKTGFTICLDRWDELKIVYTGENPIEQWGELIKATDPHALFLQPCSGKNIPQTVSFILDNPVFRLSLQTHKTLNIR